LACSTEETKSNTTKVNNTGTKWQKKNTNTKPKSKGKPKPTVDFKNYVRINVHNRRTQYSTEQFS